MADLLQSLRKATTENVPIQLQDGHYIIGDQRFHEASKTIFKRTLKSDDYHYTLKDIVFFLENSSLSVAEYRRKAVETRITAVVEQDRHALQQYLTGKIDNCPQLDFPAATAIAAENAKLSGKDLSAKPAKKESNKRKHSAIQSEGYQVNSEDSTVLQSLRADEHSPFSRFTVLNAVGTDFAIALKLFNDKVLKPKEDENQKKAAATTSTSSGATANDAGSSRGKHKSTAPIILVPTALTSNITMFNAKEFLETGNLNLQQDHLPDRKKPKIEILLRKLADETTIHYRIIDDPTKLTNEEWDKVAAVFVTGQTWQFRGWKYDNPAELFQHVLGIHLMFDDRQAPPTIQSWNCKLLKVNQYKQHLNAGAVREFWMMVDDFIKLRKPSLL